MILTDVKAVYEIADGIPLTGFDFSILGDGELADAPFRSQGTNPTFTADQANNPFQSNKEYRIVATHATYAPTGRIGRVKWDDNGNPIPLSDVEDGDVQAGKGVDFKIFDNYEGLSRYKGKNTTVQVMGWNTWSSWDYNPTSTLTVDWVTVVPAANGGRWERKITDRIDVREFGMKTGRGVSNQTRTDNVTGWQKAIRSQYPLRVPPKDFEFNGTATATDVHLDIEGYGYRSSFYQMVDADHTFVQDVYSQHKYAVKDIRFVADGRDNANNPIRYTIGVALKLWNFNVQNVPDYLRQSENCKLIGIISQGGDYTDALPVQEWKTDISLRAPSGLVMEYCRLRGADGEKGKGTTNLIIESSRQSVVGNIHANTFELAEKGVVITANNSPSLEGFIFEQNVMQGHQVCFDARSNGYKAPDIKLLYGHFKAAQVCVAMYNWTHTRIVGNFMYNQGNKTGDLSAFVTQVLCNAPVISNNNFEVYYEGGATNDVYGILVNSPIGDNPSVQGEISHNYFGNPIQTNVPAVWIQGQSAYLWRIYSNKATGFRPNDCWKADNIANDFDGQNLPRDFADYYGETKLSLLSGNEYKLDLFYPPRGLCQNITNSGINVVITDIVLQPTVIRYIRLKKGTIIRHNANSLWLDGEEDIVVKKNDQLFGFMGGSGDGISRQTRELPYNRTVIPETTTPTPNPGTGDPNNDTYVDSDPNDWKELVATFIDGLPSSIKGTPNTYAFKDRLGDGSSRTHEGPFSWSLADNPSPSLITISNSGVLTNNYGSGAGLVGTVTVVATPTNGNAEPAQFKVSLYSNDSPGTNPPPVVANEFPDQLKTAGVDFYFDLPTNQFSDPGDTLTYVVTQTTGGALPSWLNYNAATRRFSGWDGFTTKVQVAIRVRVYDSAGQSVYDDFLLTINPLGENHPPVVQSAQVFLTSQSREPFSYDFPANRFSDPDGDPLTWSMQYSNNQGATWVALPSWASFSSSTRTFSGTPPYPTGTWKNYHYDFKFIVNDGRGGTAEDAFPLLVSGSSDVALAPDYETSAVATSEYTSLNLTADKPLQGKTFGPLYWQQAPGSGNAAGQSITFDLKQVRNVAKVVVYLYPDNNTVEPDDSSTAVNYGLTGFQIQVPNGSGGWLIPSGGTVTGNTLAKRTINFSGGQSTSQLRLFVTGAADNVARLMGFRVYTG